MFISEDMETQHAVRASKTWEPKTSSNVVININKYIAKYDFDIAAKLKYTTQPRTPKKEAEFTTCAIFEILDVCSHELTKHRVTFQSIWTFNGEPVTDLNRLDADCRVCVVSEMPMAEGPANFSKSQRERSVVCASDC
jgi:hypothetical protein